MVPTENSGGVLRSSGKSADDSKSNGHFFVSLDESRHSDFISEESSLLLVSIGMNDTS